MISKTGRQLTKRRQKRRMCFLPPAATINHTLALEDCKTKKEQTKDEDAPLANESEDHVHSANVRHILLHAILLGQGVRVLEKDEAIPALHVHAIHREGGRPISHAVRVVRVPAHAAAHAGGHGVEEEPLDVGGEAPVAQIAHEDGADGHAAAGAAVEGAVVGHAVAVAVAVAAQGVLGVAAHAGVGGLAVVAHGEVVVDGAAAVGVLVHVVGVVAVLGVVHGRVAVMSLFLGSGCWS
mmetsp:Transcript_4088/g.8821  ORF Transcript_4088/g.8821 Transcript_4088/m.8821 type:complete len:238 (-) Transcript_4088:28-741(-)